TMCSTNTPGACSRVSGPGAGAGASARRTIASTVCRRSASLRRSAARSSGIGLVMSRSAIGSLVARPRAAAGVGLRGGFEVVELPHAAIRASLVDGDPVGLGLVDEPAAMPDRRGHAGHDAMDVLDQFVERLACVGGVAQGGLDLLAKPVRRVMPLVALGRRQSIAR